MQQLTKIYSNLTTLQVYPINSPHFSASPSEYPQDQSLHHKTLDSIKLSDLFHDPDLTDGDVNHSLLFDPKKVSKKTLSKFSFSDIKTDPLKSTSSLNEFWSYIPSFIPFGIEKIKHNPGHENYLKAMDIISSDPSNPQDKEVIKFLMDSVIEEHPLARMNLLHLISSSSNYSLLESWANNPQDNPPFTYILSRGLILGEFTSFYFLHRNSVLGTPSILDEFVLTMLFHLFRPLLPAFQNDLLLLSYSTEIGLNPFVFHNIGKEALLLYNQGNQNIKKYPPALTTNAIASINFNQEKNGEYIYPELDPPHVAAEKLIKLSKTTYPHAFVEYLSSTDKMQSSTQTPFCKRSFNRSSSSNDNDSFFDNFISENDQLRKLSNFPGNLFDKHLPMSLLWNSYSRGNLSAHALCANSIGSRIFFDSNSDSSKPQIQFQKIQDFKLSLDHLSFLQFPEFEYYRAMSSIFGLGQPQDIPVGMDMLYSLAKKGLHIAAFQLGTLYLGNYQFNNREIESGFPLPSHIHQISQFDSSISPLDTNTQNPWDVIPQNYDYALQWFQHAMDFNTGLDDSQILDWQCVSYQGFLLAKSVDFDTDDPRFKIGWDMVNLSSNELDLDGMFAKLILIYSGKLEHDPLWVLSFFLHLEAKYPFHLDYQSPSLKHILRYLDWISSLSEAEYSQIVIPYQSMSPFLLNPTKQHPIPDIDPFSINQVVYDIISKSFSDSGTSVSFFDSVDLFKYATSWRKSENLSEIIGHYLDHFIIILHKSVSVEGDDSDF